MIFLRSTAAFLSVVAVVLATWTAGSAPAYARDNRDDFFRLLVGAAAVAIVIKAFDENDNRPGVVYPGNVLPNHCLETVRIRGRDIDVYHARCLNRAGVKNLPSDCRSTIRTDLGKRTVYGARCLVYAGFRAERMERVRLPRACSMTYRIGNDLMSGYYATCLARLDVLNLPRYCEFVARSRTGSKVIYDADCLARAGYDGVGSDR